MKNLKITLTALALIIVSIGANAQEPSFRLNQFNTLLLNPAHSGANPYSDISVVGVSQWAGIPGAPKTAVLSGNFNLSRDLGLGVLLMQDEIGPVKTLRSSLNAGYKLKLNKNWTFALGLKGIVGNTTVNLENDNISFGDPDLFGQLSTGMSFNAGFGFLLYSKDFYLGYSQPRVASLNYVNFDMTDVIDSKGGHIVYVGMDKSLNRQWKWRPNIVARHVKNLPFILSANSIFSSDSGLDLGVSYEWKNSLGLIAGMNINNQFYIGYSYSYPMNRLSSVTFQTHEIGLRYMFNHLRRSYQGPRFFNN